MDKGTKQELDIRFTYHEPTAIQSDHYEEIRTKAKKLAALMVERCPESRERSLALTSIEEAVFWANAAIARRT